MRLHGQRLLFGVIFPLLAGCGSEPTAAVVLSAGKSDPEKVRSADVSALFVGNSHTTSHALPDLVGQMIRFRHPEKTVYSHIVPVAFLDDAARDPRCREEIESRPWKYVVLQAQRISASGRFDYSRAEGIDIAQRARDGGATVIFFAEWGLKDVADNGPRTEAIYQEMADASGARLAAVGRAWDLALSRRPDLPLHAADGNHETALGAFLTACVLFGALTDESPAALASFPYPAASEADRRLLADAAARARAPGAAGRDDR
jgi:hypothetical protein